MTQAHTLCAVGVLGSLSPDSRRLTRDWFTPTAWAISVWVKPLARATDLRRRGAGSWGSVMTAAIMPLCTLVVKADKHKASKSRTLEPTGQIGRA